MGCMLRKAAAINTPACQLPATMPPAIMPAASARLKPDTDYCRHWAAEGPVRGLPTNASQSQPQGREVFYQPREGLSGVGAFLLEVSLAVAQWDVTQSGMRQREAGGRAGSPAPVTFTRLFTGQNSRHAWDREKDRNRPLTPRWVGECPPNMPGSLFSAHATRRRRLIGPASRHCRHCLSRPATPSGVRLVGKGSSFTDICLER